MTAARPKYTRKDATQAAIVKELREKGYLWIDTSSLPGHPKWNPLDGFVCRNPQIAIAYCLNDIIRAVDGNDGRWVQIELKPDYGSSFTENELVYLESKGVL